MLWRKDLHLPTSRITGNLTGSLASILSKTTGASHNIIIIIIYSFMKNDTARLITQTARHEHIIPILRELHWLPVQRRIQFYTAVQDISGHCTTISVRQVPDHCLRSSAAVLWVVPRTKTQMCDRSFAVTGLQIWNRLPASMCLIEDSGYFTKLLKAHLFNWGCTA